RKRMGSEIWHIRDHSLGRRHPLNGIQGPPTKVVSHHPWTNDSVKKILFGGYWEDALPQFLSPNSELGKLGDKVLTGELVFGEHPSTPHSGREPSPLKPRG